jgi:hypothetical protein
VLNSLAPLKGPKIRRMWSHGVEFLKNEMLPGGIWRYWTLRAPPWVPILQPDLDDTVTAADILLTAGALPVDNREIIRRNMDTRGRFLTWLLPSERTVIFDVDPASHLSNVQRMPSAVYGAENRRNYFRWMKIHEFPNETDSAVNANVLLYLREEIPSVCAYLNSAVERDEPSVYYLNAPSQFYMYGRAFKRGIHCGGPSKDRIISRMLQMQGRDGSFGSPQKTALALNVLQDFDYRGEALELGTRFLLSTQKPDGSWDDEFFFKESAFCKECRLWRSAALSSALAVEALTKYRGAP